MASVTDDKVLPAVTIKFSTYNGCSGEDELHIVTASDGRRADRIVGHSRLARWFSRRALINKLVAEYRWELKNSLRDYENSIQRMP